MAASEAFSPPPDWELIGKPAGKAPSARPTPAPAAKPAPTPAPKPGYTREDVLQPPPGYSSLTEPAEQVSTFGPLMHRLPEAVARLSDPSFYSSGQAERGYEKYVRDPAEHYVAGGAEAIHAPQAWHALMSTAGIGDPKTYQATQAQFARDFPEVYSPTAQNIAKAVVPPTLPAAAQDVAMLAMGPAEGAVPVLGRTVGMGLARGAAEKELGTGSFGGGFLTGAGTQLAGDLPSWASTRIARGRVSAAETRTLQNDVARWGAMVEKHLPFLKKGGFMPAEGVDVLPSQGVGKTEDIIREFVAEPAHTAAAVRKAGKIHGDVVDKVQKAVADQQFIVPMPGPKAFLQGHPDFDETDILERSKLPRSFKSIADEITAIRDRGYTIKGVEAGSELAQAARDIVPDLRKALEVQLEGKVKPELLQELSAVRKQFDGASQLAKLFSDAHLQGKFIDQARGTFKPEAIQLAFQKAKGSLQRAFGGARETQDLINTLRQGAETGITQLGKAGTKERIQIPGLHIPLPLTRTIGGEPFRPPGKAGQPLYAHADPYIQRAIRGAQYAINNWISNYQKGQIYKPAHSSPAASPGMQEIKRMQAEKIAPRGGVEHALKISEDLRTGKTPDVQAHLDRGRLSHDELKQILQQASTMSSGDPTAMTANLQIQDLVSAAESGNLHERQMLMSVIMQRLQAEMPKMQNKTMQAQLARRVQNLQLAVG